jgi:hypothetical protein
MKYPSRAELLASTLALGFPVLAFAAPDGKLIERRRD